MRSVRLLAATVAMLVTIGLVGACAPAPAAFRLEGLDLAGATLTHEHGDTFEAKRLTGTWRISSGSRNYGSNTRMVFWSTDRAPADNGESCARFDQNSVWPTQEGVALRIGTVGGQTRAVTVTKNVFGYATHIYNVHSWNGADRTLHARVDASRSLAGSGAVNLCGRIDGNIVRVKIWRSSSSEPSWDDRSKVSSVKVQSLDIRSGHFGVYAGHLPANTSIQITQFRASGAPLQTPATTAPPRTTPPTTAPSDTTLPTTTLPSPTTTTVLEDPDLGSDLPD